MASSSSASARLCSNSLQHLWILCLVVLPLFEHVAEAGCRQSRLCCLGKDNKCIASGPRLSNKHSRTCYCDSECTVNADCCTDYGSECQAVDCVSSVWSEWSECSTQCGMGVRERRRRIIVEPLYDGRPCGPLSEKATCEGTNCKLLRMLGGHEEAKGTLLHKETGTIVPASFGMWRKDKLYSPFQDIRRNLFNRYENKSADVRTSYCAYYQLTEVRPYCWSSTVSIWTKRLNRGTIICVECQPMAMKVGLGDRCVGHGHYQHETRWSAFTASKCSGNWIRKTRHAQCQCDPTNQLSFVLI